MAITHSASKAKNNTCATVAAAPAIPVKPNTAAINATMKNKSARRSMAKSPCKAERPPPIGGRSAFLLPYRALELRNPPARGQSAHQADEEQHDKDEKQNLRDLRSAGRDAKKAER